MNCPICTSSALQPITLAENLAAHSCPQCNGVFLAAAEYWAWRDQHGPDMPAQTDPAPAPLVAEPARARQCSFCRHLMLPFRIALDVPFTLDHCGACNGMWFDKGEWASLQRRNLHDDLHEVFGEPWQRRLRAAEHAARMAAIYREKFGAGDYAELRRVKAWLHAHPQRQAMRAYLNADDPYHE